MNHFLFTPGEWQGSGTVSFTMSPEVLSFKTSWIITSLDEGKLQAIQTVDVQDGDTMSNVFTIVKSSASSFDLLLENEGLGSFQGKGVLDDEKVAWEFSSPGLMDGIEVYHRTGDQIYRFRAEYNGGDGFRTIIEGELYPYGYSSSEE